MRTSIHCCIMGLTVLLLCSCAGKKPGADMPAPHARGQLVLPNGAPVPDTALPAMTAKAEFVLIGERHDSALDHETQARLIDITAKSGRKMAVGLEMVPRKEFSKPLADFSAGRVSLEKLPKSLGWQKVWGYDFTLYEPVFRTAKEHALPLYGLNLPNKVRAAVSKKGLAKLTPAEKAALPASIIPPSEEQKEELSRVFLLHAATLARRGKGASGGATSSQTSTGTGQGLGQGMGRDPQATRLVMPVSIKGSKDGKNAHVTLPVSLKKPFERFVLVQSLWDSTMAEEAAFVRKSTGLQTVVLAGAGHTQKGAGIGARLPVFAPGANVFTIMPFSGEKPEPGGADLFYYSPPEGRARLGFYFKGRQDGSLLVTQVTPGSGAARAGLQKGDAITGVEGMPVRSAGDIHRAAVRKKRAGEKLSLTVQRAKEQLTLLIP